MKKLVLFLFTLALGATMFVQNVNAAVGVTITNPTNTTPNLAASYTSLANAITALNAITAISGPVTLTLNGSETAPAGGYAITAVPTGISATNNIISRKMPTNFNNFLWREPMGSQAFIHRGIAAIILGQ